MVLVRTVVSALACVCENPVSKPMVAYDNSSNLLVRLWGRSKRIFTIKLNVHLDIFRYERLSKVKKFMTTFFAAWFSSTKKLYQGQSSFKL